MAEIQLVKRGNLVLTDSESAIVRRVLFDVVDGLGDTAKKRWRRFWNGILKAEAGEMAIITTATKRVGAFHRRHMLIESRVFDAQERIADFEQFRLWLKLGAGFVDWMAGPRGGVVPVPKSISYAECEEVTFREFHDAAMRFLRSDHAMAYLWPKLPPQQRCDAVDAILLPFEE
jgi:hypothetical protein